MNARSKTAAALGGYPSPAAYPAPSYHRLVDVPEPPRYAAIAGLDLSLSATGLAVSYTDPTRGGVSLNLIGTDPADYRSARDAKDRPVATYADRRNRLGDIVDRIQSAVPYDSLVFLEAPSYGSNTSGTFDRSGLWWLTYEALTQVSECRVVPVAPSQRMQYATGKGRADKDAVLAATVRRYPDLDIRDNNVADAVVLMAMARRVSGDPMETSVPEGSLKALTKLEAL